MEPMYVSIRLPETGNHIKQLLKTSGYTVKDIQSAMGFETPQAIYKWMSGKSLPSLDNLLILSKILHSSMEDILVVDGDVVLYTGVFGIPLRTSLISYASSQWIRGEIHSNRSLICREYRIERRTNV